MPSDRALKLMNGVNRALQLVSGQRLGWSFGGMPVLELTTTGRKSGRARPILLTSPLQFGDTFVVVASRGGDDTHPAWLLNLRDDPGVTVRTRSSTRRMTARVASTEERAELWPRIAREHGIYAGYQSKTDREIPLVFLEP